MDQPKDHGAVGGVVGSVVGAFAGEVSGRGKAAVRHNLALRGCRLCGDVTLERDGDDVKITAARASGVMQVMYLVTLLGFVFSVVAAILLAAPFLPGVAPSVRYESDVRTLNTAMIITAALFVLNAAVMALAGRGSIEHVRVRRSDLTVRRSGRLRVLRGPLGRDGRQAIMVVRPASRADKELIAKVLE